MSRGAAHADLVEIAPRSLKAIGTNLAAVDAGALLQVHRTDALRFIETLEPHSYDVAFADPPYDLGLAAKVAENAMAREAALLTVPVEQPSSAAISASLRSS